jgi:hypothetical protein
VQQQCVVRCVLNTKSIIISQCAQVYKGLLWINIITWSPDPNPFWDKQQQQCGPNVGHKQGYNHYVDQMRLQFSSLWQQQQQLSAVLQKTTKTKHVNKYKVSFFVVTFVFEIERAREKSKLDISRGVPATTSCFSLIWIAPSGKNGQNWAAS